MGPLHVAILAAVAGLCGCPEPEEPIPPDVGKRTLSMAWKVTDLNDVELTCDQIGAQFVTVTFFRIRTGEAFNDLFDCFRMAGTKELEDDAYMIGFDLADRFGTLAAIPPRRVEITADAALDDAALDDAALDDAALDDAALDDAALDDAALDDAALDVVTFRIDPSGALVLALDTGLPANCAGGSSITGVTIELFRSSGGCHLTTLEIEGAAPYDVDCAAPSTTSCIERDQDITGAGLPADEYRIRVVALEGATPCWEHDQLHRVRAAGLSRALVLPLMKTCN